MKKLSIGDVSITSIIERDGPWRTPQEMFPAYDPIIGKRHLAELDPAVFDPASGRGFCCLFVTPARKATS